MLFLKTKLVIDNIIILQYWRIRSLLTGWKITQEHSEHLALVYKAEVSQTTL